jgi:hypothetical protein
MKWQRRFVLFAWLALAHALAILAFDAGRWKSVALAPARFRPIASHLSNVPETRDKWLDQRRVGRDRLGGDGSYQGHRAAKRQVMH